MPEYNNPGEWLKRLEGYTGILEGLSRHHKVVGVERISYEGIYRQNGVEYFFIRSMAFMSRFPIRSHWLMRKMRPDVVFVNGFIFPVQLIHLKLVLGNNVKIIVINHAEKPGTGKRKLLQRIADRYVYKYLFTSREMGLEWVKGGIISTENKIAQVMEASSAFNAVDKRTARQNLGIKDGPVFLFVGRLDENKDPMNVLKAFTAFVAHQSMAKLYMIYHAGKLKPDVEDYCRRTGLLNRFVILVGQVAHAEMQYWYSSADFIVSASHYEGSGVAVCEAMSCGCIPILTNIPSFRAMSGEGRCGFLYEPGDADALLGILLQTKAMDLETEKEKTIQQFRDELSFEAITAKIESIIAEGK